MPHFLRNIPYVTSLNQSFFLNESETWIYIIKAKNELRPLSEYVNNYLYIIGIVWVCTIIISYFRYILYSFLYEQYKLKKLNPIDILTLLHALSDHVRTLCLAVYLSFIFINAKSLQVDTGGTLYCITLIYTAAFLRAYYFIGGLMMSVYRILLIKRGDWVRRIGQRNLLILLLFLSMVIVSMDLSLKATNDYEQLRRDTCQIVFRPNILLLLDEYEQSLGRSSILSYYYLMNLTKGCIRICIKISEIIIYVIFFHFVYKNDNSFVLRRLLGPEVIQCRNRKNAVTFFVQFCAFAFELSWTVVYIYCTFVENRTTGSITLRFAIRIVSATCTPIITVVASKTLRKRIYKFNFYNFIFGLK